VATLPLALANSGGIASNPLLQRANKIIVLSDRAEAVYTRYGVPADKIAIIPNGLDIPSPESLEPVDPSHWVGIGRLTPEKGFADLVGSWPAGPRLDIIGGGPEADAIQAAANPLVRLLPPIANKELMALVPGYAGLVLPSKWFEGLPTVVLEALGSGVPVIAREGNSAADFFLRNEPTWVYDGSSSSLQAALDSVESLGSRSRLRARELFVQKFSLQTWVFELESVFRALI
jgi:glycosyltransferase involved in cell wall biosynthesis